MRTTKTIGLLALFLLPHCNCEDLGRIDRVEFGDLTGVACSETTGFPMRGALINLDVQGTLLETVTDERGAFRFEEVTVGTYPLTIDVGREDRSMDVTIEFEQITHVVDSACRDEYVGVGVGDVEGVICNRHVGDLIQDGAVTLTLADGTTVETTTDENGAFLLRDIPEGEHIVQVTAPGFSRAWPVSVEAGEVFFLDGGESCQAPDANSGLVSGVLCDPGSSGPWAGAVVTAEDSRGEVYEDLTDTEGTFTLGPMAPGSVAITVSDGTSTVTLGAIVRGGEEVTVTNGGGCVEETCISEAVLPTESQEGVLMLVVDRSGSMSNAAPSYGTTRWAGVVQAVKAVTGELEDAIEFGLMLFPHRDDDSCGAGGIDVEPAYGRAGDIADQLDEFESSPLGATPTSGTLAAVRSYMNGFASSGKNIAVVLATDGGPNCNALLDPLTCTCSNPDADCSLVIDGSLCLDNAAAVSEVSALAADGIATYVIGIPGVENFAYVLNDMAEAGGTAAAGATKYIEASDIDTLQEAFRAIGRQVSACSVQLTEDLDLTNRVNVLLGGEVIEQDPSHEDGFDLGEDNTIQLFGRACDAWQGSQVELSVDLCTLDGGEGP